MDGNTGLQHAVRRPNPVPKLVAISANDRSDDYYPGGPAMIQTIAPEVFAGPQLGKPTSRMLQARGLVEMDRVPMTRKEKRAENVHGRCLVVPDYDEAIYFNIV